jgi:hypothetical protein
MRRKLLPLILGLVGMLACRPGPAAELTVAGGPRVVFASRDSRCAANDIPDAPARAFRDGAGAIRLFAAHAANRSFAGPTLDAVKRDCHLAFEGGGNDDPAAFDDRIWLTSFWTTEGQAVHALGHAEYHGHLRPGVCPSGRYMACWWNAVVQVVSEDGGETFRRADGPGRGLVASVPYRYDPRHGHPAGYFSPSNIIERDGHWYVFVFAESFGAQRRGACLLRTARIEDPSSWRAWDGRDFTIAFVNPYSGSAFRPEDHVCAPLAEVSSTIFSVARLPGTRGFVALITASRQAETGGKRVSGVYYITSADLIHWTKPKLLLAVPIMFAFPCDAASAYAYPSLLDENSASRTFETVGGEAFLYLTRIKVRECRLTMERELVRYPLYLR